MSDPKKPSFAALARGYELLLMSGLLGVQIGFLAGAVAGLFLLIFGIIYGMILGVPAGFCAAVFAVAIGGRHKCARFGALFGGVAGAAVLIAISLESRGISWSVFTANDPAQVALVAAEAAVGYAVAAFVGYVVGTYIDPRLRIIPGYTGMFRPLAVTLDQSGFYQLPLAARLCLAIVLTAPMCVAMPWVLRLVYSVWRPFG